jgi:hypothetical protein
LSTASAAVDNGTTCSRALFILAAGSVHSLRSKSTSCHRAPSASLGLAAVAIMKTHDENALPSWHASARKTSGAPSTLTAR